MAAAAEVLDGLEMSTVDFLSLSSCAQYRLLVQHEWNK